MEVFRKKHIVLKIVIALVIVILFNFSAPTISRADSLGEAIGGTLLTPIVDLLLAIGDGAMHLIQKLILGMDSSLTKISNEWSDALSWGIAILSAAIVIGLAIVTCGVSLVVVGAAAVVGYAAYKISAANLPPTFYLPMYVVSPEEIFTNQIALLDVNFFNPNQYQKVNIGGAESNEQISSAGELQGTIASWYLALRNFALIVLLSILLYTGIKIIISSSSQDKAKYKEKLYNWFISVCLLFFMHYVMAFATTVVQEITNGINSMNNKIKIELPDLSAEDYDVEAIENGEAKRVSVQEWFEKQSANEQKIYDDGNYYWYTNLMGRVRLEMQLEDPSVTEDNEILSKAGYTILFLILVFYTVAFLVVYIKRLIMLAFLTMIAPLVAMTYSLDKMRDGNAQAFNLWIKEYAFNLLIQPFHLILYTMLVGSAMQFASDNMIYAIVAIGFIFQAEKLLRKFFGFDSASTISNGSAIGGALAMAGVGALKRIAGGGSKNKQKGGKESGKESGGNERIRTNRTNELLDENSRTENQDNTDNARNNTSSSGMDEEKERQRALEKYNNEGFGQNANGEYFNPWTDEYDPDYDPTQDKSYNSSLQNTTRGNEPSETNDTESDTRGMGQWIRDMYQGSSLQEGVNTVTAPVRFVRNKVAKGVNSVRDLVGKGVRKIPKPIRNTIRGAVSVGAQGLKYVAPRAARLYVKGALAATAGTIGVAAGLASDDDRNILKYGAAGAGAGWLAGSGALNVAGNISSGIQKAGESAASTYTLNARGVEAERQRQIAIEERAAMKDKNRQRLYKEKLGLKNNEQVKAALEDARKFRENGIMDDELIIKAMDAEGFGDERASRERIILAGLASETKNDNKKIKDVQSRLQERGLSNDDVKKYIDGIRDITGAV